MKNLLIGGFVVLQLFSLKAQSEQVDNPATSIPSTSSGSTSRPLSSHFSDVVHVRDRGVKCDGTTDDTAAINALTATTPKNIAFAFPSGVCRFSGTLTFHLNSSAIVGAGSQATLFLYDGPDTKSDLMYVGDAYNPILQGFSVWSSTNMTKGAAIHIVKSSYAWLRDLGANYYQTNKNTLWDGLWIDQPNFVHVDNFYFQAKNDAIATSALGVGTPFQYDVFIDNGKLSQSANGLHVGGGIDNVHVDNTEITSNAINVLDDNSISPFKNQEIYVGANVVTDQAAHYNYYIDDTYCNLRNYGIVSISGPITAAHLYDGIYVKSFPSCLLVVKSPLITHNGRDGIHTDDPSAIISIAPETIITANASYGIDAGADWSHLYSTGQVYGNKKNSYGAKVTLPNSAPYHDLTITGKLTAADGVQSGSAAINPVLVGVTENLGGATLSTGTCLSKTTKILGATNNMTVLVSPSSNPGGNLVWNGYVSSANIVTVNVCAIAPSHSTATRYNIRVIQ